MKIVTLILFLFFLTANIFAEPSIDVRELITKEIDIQPHGLNDYCVINNTLIIGNTCVINLKDFNVIHTFQDNKSIIINTDGNIYYRPQESAEDFVYSVNTNLVNKGLFVEGSLLDTLLQTEITNIKLYDRDTIIGLVTKTDTGSWDPKNYSDIVLYNIRVSEIQKQYKDYLINFDTFFELSFDGEYALFAAQYQYKVFNLIRWKPQYALRAGHDADTFLGGFIYQNIMYGFSLRNPEDRFNYISFFNIKGQEIVRVRVDGWTDSEIKNETGIKTIWIDYECEKAFITLKNDEKSYFIDMKPVKKMLEEKGYTLEKRKGKVTGINCSMYYYPKESIDRSRVISPGTEVIVFEKRTISRESWYYIKDENSWLGWIKEKDFEFIKEETVNPAE